MNNSTVEQDRATIIFRQMGGKVKSIHGVQCYIKFCIDDSIEVYYVYNVNKDNEYYLQRIKPYPFGAGVFTSVDMIIQFVKEDLERFKNASLSSVFDIFIENNQRLNTLMESIENLFLRKNVPKDKMLEISNILEELDIKIMGIYNNSPDV